MAGSGSGSAESSSVLVCNRGDLLLVDKKHHSTPAPGLIRATNERTNRSGVFYRKSLRYLPTLSRPSEDLLVTGYPSPTNPTTEEV